ncbi:MAG: hypothetical protein N4A62_08395 [Marinisporobacter sp.]|jgi:gas vesicle protein|nr:hypothetical protein [Marinisporobacter sp.]
MKMKLIKNTPEKEIINEIQELKNKITELKKSKISKNSSILLQTFDKELSNKIKYYTSEYCSM